MAKFYFFTPGVYYFDPWSAQPVTFVAGASTMPSTTPTAPPVSQTLFPRISVTPERPFVTVSPKPHLRPETFMRAVDPRQWYTIFREERPPKTMWGHIQYRLGRWLRPAPYTPVTTEWEGTSGIMPTGGYM